MQRHNISYLIEAVSQRHPAFGQRAHSVLRQMGGPGSSRPGVTAFLLAEMQDRLREPCTFIIDDWQFVASVTEVRGLWNQILRDAPPTCRFVFASRGKPQLQFARFKTHGGYAEMRTDGLRMTEEEIGTLFREVYGDPLSPDEARTLEERTEGWAASLQLIEVSLRERRTPADRSALIESIRATSDTDLFRFLAEEVLDQQSDEVRNFLLSTSILQQITPELAERLSGVHDGTRRLMQLEQAGLFTHRVDETRYRYHGLFRDFLERRLVEDRAEAEVTSLHIHAASYYETSTQWPEAIRHYLRAGLQPQAARLIARYGEEVVGEGRLGLVDEWLQQLPGKVIRDNARLSLLHGEALGIRGEYEPGLSALERARTFFARKGDRRMEAVALVKLSSLYHHWGKPDTAAEVAGEGLRISPEDARVLRLRLAGNLAITSSWLYSPLQDTLASLMRLTAEASQLGLDHYAAIGLHNVGHLQYEMGQISRAAKSLETAAGFWNQLPPNPFGDNYNLARTYLTMGDVRKAREVAQLGEIRTRSWRRPNTEARCGLAAALAAAGDLEGSIDVLRPVALDVGNHGNAAEAARIHFLEVSMLQGSYRGEAEIVRGLLRDGDADPRLEVPRLTAVAVYAHHLGECGPSCGEDALRAANAWRTRGAVLPALTSLIMLAPLFQDHRRSDAANLAFEAIAKGQEIGALRSLAPWLKRLSVMAPGLARLGGCGLLAGLVDADPNFWIERLPELPWEEISGDRQVLMKTVERHSNADTPNILGSIPNDPFRAVRERLTNRQAPRLFIRTFGSVEVHRGGWSGPAVRLTRRRTRALLGLLAAHSPNAVNRDVVLDTLWPESDPAAAVNSLNQTLFQLRREIDPDYRNGLSPEYLQSSPEWLQLNPDLVRLDWAEAIRRAPAGHLTPARVGEYAAFVGKVIDGEFLAEARYEDWATTPRSRVHEQLREVLLPIAQDSTHSAQDRIRLAHAAIHLDTFDELAHIALARALADSGRRAAAFALLKDFARRLNTEFEEDPSNALTEATAALQGKSISTELRARRAQQTP